MNPRCGGGVVSARAAACAAVVLVGSGCGDPGTGPATATDCDWAAGLDPLVSTGAPVDYALPDSVLVLPVFFVPSGQPEPTAVQDSMLVRHVHWARERFREMLGGSTTFRLASDSAHIHHGDMPLSGYRSLPAGGSQQYLSELLPRYGLTRFTSPFLFVIVVMNPSEDFPTGGGAPVNGGFTTGGGLVILSSYALDQLPHVQSTLRHELGHALGLPHVDAYGYDMQANTSIMSYNPAHHTDGFEESAQAGVLIAEDLRGLSWNDRSIPGLTYDSAWLLSSPTVWYPPMTGIPGQPESVVRVRTASGELYGSRVSHIVQGVIRPSAGPGITFDAGTMWHSDTTANGWVSVEIGFPVPVTLDRIDVHSQHSGLHHAAGAVRISALEGEAPTTFEQLLNRPEARVSFPPTTAQRWCLSFRAADSRLVVIRGLEFFDGAREIFPPLVPPQP